MRRSLRSRFSRDSLGASIIARMPTKFLSAAAVEFVRRLEHDVITVWVDDSPAVLLVSLGRSKAHPTVLIPKVTRALAAVPEME